MSIKRRDFLKLTGSISLGLPLYNCVLDRGSDSIPRSNWFAAVENWMPAVCQECTGGCGILVRLIDDRAVKIEGNPLHLLNRGKVCPRGQAGLQSLYRPDRIRGPVRKQGPRGSGKWEPMDWDKALELVFSKLQELRNSGKSHTMAFLGPDTQNTTDDLVARFLEVYGTPNYLKFDEWVALKETYYRTQGIYDLLAFDMENCRYILSFEADFLTNWPNSMENQRIYGDKRAKRDIKIIHVGPRFSLCASRADKWIPINPETEGLFALGIASVIVREKLYNAKYLDKFTLDFPNFKKTLQKEINLDRISEITGVPLRTIIEIAKEFSINKPAIAVADYNFSFHSKGSLNLMAIHSLNALVGSIDTPGGLLRQRKAPLKSMPQLTLDKTAITGLSRPRVDGVADKNISGRPVRIRDFVNNIIQKKPYEINCLFISGNTRLFSSPISSRLKKAIQDIPFVVSFSQFFDETAELADVILPDTTYFEKWQEIQVSPLFKNTVVGVSQPILKPLYNTRPLEEVILALARKIDYSMSQNFPWKNFKELIFYRLKGLYESKKGSVFTSFYEEAQLKLLEERGWWFPLHDSLDSFMKDLLAKGGWQDPAYHFNERSYIYQTPTRRFEFLSSLNPQDILPEFSGRESEYPFVLHLYDLPFTLPGYAPSLPWHQESAGFRFGKKWEIWAEINPEAAKKLSIRDNDRVWVESPYGKVKAVAKIFPGIMPHVVSLPLEKKEEIPWVKNTGNKNDPLVLLGEEYDRETAMVSRQSTRVKVYKCNE